MSNIKEEALKLLQDLVKIPSHGSDNVDRENKVIAYVETWLESNCAQYTISRFKNLSTPNLLCAMSENPKVLLACHADTMPPTRKDHTHVTIDGDKIAGLGTKDMKGGLVASMLALKYSKNPENVALLVYGDEEYTQSGTREFSQLVHEGGFNMHPDVIVSPESRFNLVYSARGIVMMEIEVRGQVAHSSRPHQGTDAIKLFYEAFAQFESEIGVKTDLGATTTTIAHIVGGVAGEDGEDGEVIMQGGMVPDIVNATIAIRNSHMKLRGDDFAEMLHKLLQSYKLRVAKLSVQIDHPTRRTSQLVVDRLVATVYDKTGEELELGDPALAGYNDVALLGDAMGDVPVVNFGPYGEGNHMEHEWVSLSSIERTIEIFSSWIDDAE